MISLDHLLQVGVVYQAGSPVASRIAGCHAG